MYSLVELTGKKIIITGASQGIGRQTAIMLSKLNAQLILIARKKDKLKETIELLEGNNHKFYIQDMGSTQEIEECVKNITDDVGKIDGLVYCAGITNDRPLSMFKPPIVTEVLNINLCGFIELVRCLSKKNRYNPGMRIVGVSSTAALRGSKAHLAYSASKAGMDGAVRCMARELAEKHICVNTVAPGMIRTAMYEKYLADNGTDSGANRGLLAKQYLGIGEPEDVAAAIAFLLSSASAFITGICLPVDGGLTSN